MFDMVGTVVTIAFAAAALAILWFDLRARRRLVDREIDLQDRKFKASQEERNGWERWLDEQKIALGNLANPMASAISNQLTADSSWAAAALEKARLGPYAETLFGERKNHFAHEKLFLAQAFGALLLRRVRRIVEDRKNKVYIVIDSGTTLFPFFSYIGREAVRAYHEGEEWIRDERVSIVTNNLPGVLELMETGRPVPDRRYGKLAVNCHLLPGTPLPIYSAVTGEETNEALRELRNKEQGAGIKFVGLVTGNWIRVHDSDDARYPIPLARGAGHRSFKSVLMTSCDEVFVLSPLGKVFVNMSIEEVNVALRLDRGAKELEGAAYEEVDVGTRVNSVKLVTTTRPSGFLLHDLGQFLQGRLSAELDPSDSSFAGPGIGEAKHCFFRFDEVPGDLQLQRREEFPHKYTRRDDFIELFTHPESRKHRGGGGEGA